MHTSHVLQASDFQYWQRAGDAEIEINFDSFCPDYHSLDRIGIVSPNLEDGILGAGIGLLALTTAYYDIQRQRAGDFFTYPHHFAIVGTGKTGIQTSNGSVSFEQAGLWDAWSWLDVWPSAKWVPTQATTTPMLQQVFDYQINRLFWPAQLAPEAIPIKLPTYAQAMLVSDLKAVYIYSNNDSASKGTAELLGVSGTTAVAKIIEESAAKLPPLTKYSVLQAKPVKQWFRQMAPADFLNKMSACFEAG